MYRAFKQECPNGIVDEETFKEVYEKIFPLGDASQYAHLVFATIDRFGNDIFSITSAVIARFWTLYTLVASVRY